ncbi:MAG: DNA polymerase III subunit delta [Actinomycetota bacterium]|nr:DNA polymerase III subunit delta [Actinomycetota bacterium]
MSDEPLRAVYLLLGSDRPKIRRAVARLRSRFAPESIELLAADTASGEDAVAACNALGLFGAAGKRLVVIEGVERWRAEDVDAVASYADDPADGSVLALVATGALRSDKLVAACERAGLVLRFDVPKPRDASVWVRAEFERLGVRADAEAARALVEIVGDDVLELASEVEKIATWAGDEPVGRREVEQLAAPSGATFVWALTDAWGERDTAATLAACATLLEGRAKEPFAIAAALAGYVSRVRAAQALDRDGASTAEIAKKLRIKDYPARKAVAHGRNYTPDELDGAIVRLADLDAALKGESRLSAELELERALIDLTAPSEVTATP